MAVIVSNKITQTGSTITGNTSQIVIVKTNPGYQPDPGHPGSGTIVAVVCPAILALSLSAPVNRTGHPYAYAASNPITYDDPSGEQAV